MHGPDLQTLRLVEKGGSHIQQSRCMQDVKGYALAMMVYRSVGVIFGDLGTSPMYIFPSTFDHPPSKADAMGALSLIIWTLSLLALLKYVLIVLWANDDGEGPIFPVT